METQQQINELQSRQLELRDHGIVGRTGREMLQKRNVVS